MNLSNLALKAEKLLRTNSPAILTAIGVSGTLTTAYLAARSGMDHRRMMEDQDPHMGLKNEAEFVWKVYIPPVVSASVTVVCIIGAAKAGSRRTAAMTAAYSISERALVEYKEKVVEVLGETQAKKLKDEMAQERITQNQPTETTTVITGSGDVLCHELHTGRYFQSSMEALRKAQNDVNAILISRDEACLGDFHQIIGLPWVTMSSQFGWVSGRLMELEFSTALTEDGKPCLAFSYNYLHLL